MNQYSVGEISDLIDKFNEREDELKRVARTENQLAIVNQLSILRDLVQMSLEIQAGLATLSK